MASSVLGQAAENTIDANAAVHEALSKISKLLPSDKQLEEMSNAKLLIGELLA